MSYLRQLPVTPLIPISTRRLSSDTHARWLTRLRDDLQQLKTLLSVQIETPLLAAAAETEVVAVARNERHARDFRLRSRYHLQPRTIDLNTKPWRVGLTVVSYLPEDYPNLSGPFYVLTSTQGRELKEYSVKVWMQSGKDAELLLPGYAPVLLSRDLTKQVQTVIQLLQKL